MLASLHAIAGALSAKMASNRREAAALGVLSHAPLDILNHEEPFSERGAPNLPFLLADLAITSGVVFSIGARRGWSSHCLVGALSSLLPDVEHLISMRLGSKNELFPFHSGRLHASIGMKVGLRQQLALSTLILIAMGLLEPGAPAVTRDSSPR